MDKPDLTYKAYDDMFTSFFPDTPQGVVAWRELADLTDGTGKVLTIQVPELVYSLECAGYVVAELPDQTLTQDEINQLADELSEF